MNTFYETIQGSTPVLVDFYADWCQPCKMQAPILQDFAKRMNGAVRVLKINVDKNPQVAAKYGIRSIPTLVLFKQGNAVWRGAGVHQTKQLEQVVGGYV
jgi:thioredoxin 1